MKHLLCALLMGIFACGAGYTPPGYITEVSPVEMKEIVFSEMYQSQRLWQATPWYRQGDLTAGDPIFVMVNRKNEGCLVPTEIWHRNPRRIACPTGWRIARPVLGR